MLADLVDREAALLGDLAQDLVKLQNLPEWGAFRKRYEELHEQAVRRMAADMLSGGETAEPLDQRKVDYRRGYLKACDDFVAYPERLVARFEKAMERKQRSG